MGIRKRLLILSVGISIPLTLAGLLMLWALWRENERELTHSIEEQSQLAAVAFENDRGHSLADIIGNWRD